VIRCGFSAGGGVGETQRIVRWKQCHRRLAAVAVAGRQEWPEKVAVLGDHIVGHRVFRNIIVD
jgi:hypothetical protein